MTIPVNWNDFLIKRENAHDTVLDVQPWFRKNRANAPKGLYYICVYGELTSTYTLNVREYLQDRKHTTLEDGYTESFGLGNNDIIVHLYHVPKLDYPGEDIKLDVNVVVRRGGRPIVAGIFCKTN